MTAILSITAALLAALMFAIMRVALGRRVPQLPAKVATTPSAGCSHGLQAAVSFDDDEPSETFIRARWDVVDVSRQGNRIAVEYLSERDWLRLCHPTSESTCSAE